MSWERAVAERFRASLDGGIKISQATNLASATQAMIPHLKRGKRCYLRNTTTNHVVTWEGFPPEAEAHNMVGEPIDLPHWVDKAQQMLKY